ncbi:MAG: agmatinase [Gammaproteobacteria bacterium]|jgi:agmatinase|nr:MAG: Agmatinase [Oceanospirillaceae bacterium UBA2001]|tara:strand:- start:177 stop:1115 length:939 start_codon:yes stop_codon:yes gene_type:complete
MAKNKLISDAPIISMYANQFSFLARPLSRDMAQEFDAAVVGLPFDLATTGRAGARSGPNAVRQASSNVGWEGRRWPWAFDAFKYLKVTDYGDLDFIPGNPQDLNREIEQHADAIISAGTCMLSVGGDHYVALPLLRAHAKHYGKMALVHFDAHTDTYPNDTEIDHGSMFYHAPKQGLIDPEHSIQVGIRTEFRPEDHEFKVIDAAQANDMSADDIVASIIKRVGQLPVYLSFDIDCLDPAYAPGTGTPVVGGLSTDKALKIIRGLKDVNIVGFDLVEVNPAYDHAEITALAGATILLEYIYLLAHKKYQASL